MLPYLIALLAVIGLWKVLDVVQPYFFQLVKKTKLLIDYKLKQQELEEIANTLSWTSEMVLWCSPAELKRLREMKARIIKNDSK